MNVAASGTSSKSTSDRAPGAVDQAGRGDTTRAGDRSPAQATAGVRAPDSATAEPPRTLGRPSPELGRLFLFSIDLEDIRSLIPNGNRYSERVMLNTDRICEFLARHDKRCTFFATGDVARRYPELLRDLASAGHEIGCHTSDHVPLDRRTKETFRDDISRCLDDYAAAGIDHCVGFRAPIGSLVKSTRWAYEVLQELGFTYSSSVLPAASPLYGWPDFGPDIPQRMNGLWEIPTTLTNLPWLNVPFAGGVYFRVLPFALIRLLFLRRLSSGYPVFGYAHPYDIDAEQERFMHPEINDNRFYNWLLYLNRAGMLPRVEKLMSHRCDIMPYRDYVERVLEGAGGPAENTSEPSLV